MVEREKLTLCDPRAVGAVIRRLRMEKGLTQEVLSGLAAISRSGLEQIERGTRRPTLETVFRLSYALCISPSTLVAEIEKSNT